jgi:hypothetical protein
MKKYAKAPCYLPSKAQNNLIFKKIYCEACSYLGLSIGTPLGPSLAALSLQIFLSMPYVAYSHYSTFLLFKKRYS